MATDFPRSYIRALLAEDEAARDKAAALHRVVRVETAVASVTAIDAARVRLQPTPDSGWRDAAACRDIDPGLFFPGPHQPDVAVAARLVCAGCEVRAECLDFAVDNDERFGIWGGKSERERRRLRRARRAGAA